MHPAFAPLRWSSTSISSAIVSPSGERTSGWAAKATSSSPPWQAPAGQHRSRNPRRRAACVTVCPTEAILVGDLNDPASKVAQVINREPVQVRRPEKNTRPGVFYKGAHQATLTAPLGQADDA
ncbi:MAG: hypothetical protein ACRDOU_12470 [Streptosporangiaceae bacterium]